MELTDYLIFVASRIKEAQEANDKDEAIRLIGVVIGALEDVRSTLKKGGQE